MNDLVMFYVGFFKEMGIIYWDVVMKVYGKDKILCVEIELLKLGKEGFK